MDIRLAGDQPLYDAIRLIADEFSAEAREASLLATVVGGLVGRNAQSFRAVGVVRDNARLCSETANPAVVEAQRLLTSSAAAANSMLAGRNF
jgi:hypothetical protein